jgi:peroxiredoxin/mono/diheme cytochrome c family protein
MHGTRSLLLSLPLTLVLGPTVASAEVAIGDKIPNLSFKDSHYVARSLDDFKGRKAFVFVFVVRGCPLVPKYLPTLDRLEKQYRARGVQFLAINVSPEDTITEATAQLVEAGVAFPVVKDFEARCADALGVTRTPEVAVLDGERRLRYRGRIDDQFRPGGIARAEPTRQDLREALDEILAGKEVSVPKTEIDGCTLTRAEDLAIDPSITFAQHIGPILAKHCVACHQPGGEATFALVTCEQVRSRGKMVAEVVREGRMPPWFAAPGHERIVNQRVLTARERDLLATWVRSGMPAGDRTTPPAVGDQPAVAWRIGEPDLVLRTDAVNLPATGQVVERYLVLPKYFAADTWVQGLQILPEDAKVVRGATLVTVPLGQGFRTENLLARLGPGSEPLQLAKGLALRIPADSVLALQVQFVTTGQPQQTRVAVGFRFARGTVDKELRHVTFLQPNLNIPPGEPAHTVGVSQTLNFDALGVALEGHLQRRGRSLTFRAILPDGSVQTLLVVANYHPDHQGTYLLEGGRKLPRGTRLEVVATYDNSAFNHFNPDPTATVHAGPLGHQEVFEAFVFLVDETEKLGLEIDEKTGRARRPVGTSDRR